MGSKSLRFSCHENDRHQRKSDREDSYISSLQVQNESSFFQKDQLVKKYLNFLHSGDTPSPEHRKNKSATYQL